MQVDPSICADTSISEKEKGVGEEEISEPFTAKLEPYLAKFINLFQITPQKEKNNHLHYANTYTWVFLSSLKEPATQESVEQLSKGKFPLVFPCYKYC